MIFLSIHLLESCPLSLTAKTSPSLERDTPEGFAFLSLRLQVILPESELSHPSIDQQIHQLEYYQRYTQAWVRQQLVRSNPRTYNEMIRLLQLITQHIELRVRQAYRLDLETEQRLCSTLAQQRNIAVTSLTGRGLGYLLLRHQFRLTGPHLQNPAPQQEPSSLSHIAPSGLGAG